MVRVVSGVGTQSRRDVVGYVRAENMCGVCSVLQCVAMMLQ